MDNENTNGKEIDVLEVLDAIAKRFGRFFSTLIKGLSKLFLAIIYFVFRNTIAVGVILVVTVGIGIYSYFSTESHFESDMKIKGNAITNQEAISYINKLSELTNPENKSILMKRLEIDSAMAQIFQKLEPIGL